MTLPTFDEWYQEQHGTSFEAEWMASGQYINQAMWALTLALREYTTEMVRRAGAACATSGARGGRHCRSPSGRRGAMSESQ